MKDLTIEYYNNKASKYYESTVNANMIKVYEEFLKEIPADGTILDAGCGSGRDSLYFINMGYSVTAFDGSKEMVKLSSNLINQEVILMTFETLDLASKYNGIWACASLLHVSRNNLEEVLRKLSSLLEDKGVLYASFKYGNTEYESNDGKYFNCYDEES